MLYKLKLSKNMTKLSILLIALVFTISACSTQNTSEQVAEEETETSHEDHQEADNKTENTGPASPKRAAMDNIGTNHVHIEYSSPKVKGRVIWGGLVSYGEVWVTGAHKATSINFPSAVTIEGNEIPAGKYALFTIPGPEEWTIILNKNFDQHLADDYNQELDVLRINVMPEALDETVEDLTYTVKSTEGNKGEISIAWEKIKVTFNIETI